MGKSSLTTAILLYFLEEEQAYCIRAATLTRYPDRKSTEHRRMYGRLSEAMNRIGAESPIVDEQGGPITNDYGGQQWTGASFKKTYDSVNLDRAGSALAILRWLASRTGRGAEDDGALLYRSFDRLQLPMLESIIECLAMPGQCEDPTTVEIIQAFNDLSELGIDSFFACFGAPIPTVQCKKSKMHKGCGELEQHTKNPELGERVESTESAERISLEARNVPIWEKPHDKESVFLIPRKYIYGLMPAFFLLFFAMGPFSGRVALNLFRAEGLQSAWSYTLRSGMLHSASPEDQRTVAFFLQRKGQQRHALRRARELQLIDDLSPKILGDAYLVEGHAQLALGELYGAASAYEAALFAYEGPIERTYAACGLIRVFTYLGFDTRHYKKIFYANYLDSNKNDDCDYLTYIYLLTLEDPRFGEKYLDQFEKPEELRELHTALARSYYAMGSKSKAFKHASIGVVMARESNTLRTELFCIAILALIESKPEWTQRILIYLESTPDYELAKFLETESFKR